MSKIDLLIERTKKCNKALMKLSFINYCNNEKYDDINDKISDKNRNNIIY